MNQLSSPPRPDAAARQQVTSSDLVRRFGVWQERAASSPVYIVHRGRPRLVLVSLDLMDALCTPHAAAEERAVDAHAVAEAVAEPLLLLNERGAIAHANAAARSRFGATVRAGATPAAISQAGGAFVDDAVARVLESGLAETISVAPDRFPTRRVDCRVTPLPSGALVHVAEASARDEALAGAAALEAIRGALDATGVAATVRINARGFMVAPGGALARLTGTVPDQLAAARFLSLLDVTDRPSAGEAIEQLFAGGPPLALACRLIVRGAKPTAVSLGLAAVRIGGRVEEVVAAITPRCA